MGEILRIRTALGYTIATGFVFAPFVAYLGSAQQVFQDSYGTGTLFPLYFGVLALSFGAGSIVNGRLVMTYGMRRLSKLAAGAIALISLVACPVAFAFAGFPIWLFMCYSSRLRERQPCSSAISTRGHGASRHIAGRGAAVIASLRPYLVPLEPWSAGLDGTMYT